jgi:lysophospholipase L1-like esterase
MPSAPLHSGTSATSSRGATLLLLDLSRAVLAALFLIAGTGLVHAGERVVVLALGDSITKGVRSGVTAEETFSARLQAQAADISGQSGVELVVVNRGIGGEQTNQALARLDRELAEHRPQYVLLMYGTNDSYVDVGKTAPRMTADEFRLNLQRLITRIRQFAAEPILMTEPAYAAVSPKNGRGEHCNILLSEFMQVTRAVANQRGCVLIDQFAGWKAAEASGRDLNDWTTDGYHPNPAGHTEMAGRIAPVLRERLALRQVLPFSAWGRAAVDVHPISGTGAAGGLLAQPDALYWRFDNGAAVPAELKSPRLARIVARAWWHPLSESQPLPVNAALTGSEFSAPFVPRADRLLKFTQTGTEWTIHRSAALAAAAGPCVVILDVASDGWGPQATGLPTPEELSSPITAGINGELVLEARLGRPTGEKLQFEPLPHKNTVGYWVNPADFVEWNLRFDRPGDYEVQIFQGCGGGQGGSEIAVAVAGQELPYTVVETGHFQNFRWQTVGVARNIPAGPATLGVRVRKLAKNAVMDVRQIRLKPVTPEQPTGLLCSTDVTPDRFPLPLTWEAPATGKRSLIRAPGYEQTEAYHVVSLPTDWQSGRKYPIYVEWTGNGGYADPCGEQTNGRPESGRLAIGLAGNDGAIVVQLPYLNAAGTANVATWWGSSPEHRPDSTLKYATAALDEVIAKWGGDPQRIVLVGFSRGAIAVNALGLANDDIAPRWKAMVAFSHYDGVRTWPFADSARASAIERLKRLGDRPQFIVSEPMPNGSGLEATEAYLREQAPQAPREFLPSGFRDHSDGWALRPGATRDRIRERLAEILR